METLYLATVYTINALLTIGTPDLSITINFAVVKDLPYSCIIE